MEQIRIRQPKMPAAQSFIQIFETFLASLANFLATFSSLQMTTSFSIKDLKPLEILVLRESNLALFIKEKMSKG